MDAGSSSETILSLKQLEVTLFKHCISEQEKEEDNIAQIFLAWHYNSIAQRCPHNFFPGGQTSKLCLHRVLIDKESVAPLEHREWQKDRIFWTFVVVLSLIVFCDSLLFLQRHNAPCMPFSASLSGIFASWCILVPLVNIRRLNDGLSILPILWLYWSFLIVIFILSVDLWKDQVGIRLRQDVRLLCQGLSPYNCSTTFRSEYAIFMLSIASSSHGHAYGGKILPKIGFYVIYCT